MKHSQDLDASAFLPPRISLTSMREAVQHCEGCSLYKNATQAVFGEGPRHASIVMIGEQPGNSEDEEGIPFVGPAGKLLNEALEAAGISRDKVYVTNAVKHFKWLPRGKRRIHSKPTAQEIRACYPWLLNELKIIKPEIIVCLGSSAALSVFHKAMPVLSNRRKWLQSDWSEKTLITVHPSSVLRTPSEARAQAKRDFFRDIAFIQKGLAS